MNTLNKLLDTAREMCGSDLQTAARLKVSRSAVSKWRQGGKIEPEHLARLLDLTHQDPALAVQVMADQGRDPAETRLWGALWDRLCPATTAVVGLLLMLGPLLPASASQGDALQAEQRTGYALREVGDRGLIRRVLGWFAAWRFHAASPVLA